MLGILALAAVLGALCLALQGRIEGLWCTQHWVLSHAAGRGTSLCWQAHAFAWCNPVLHDIQCRAHQRADRKGSVLPCICHIIGQSMRLCR